jgi:hypothetical protein
LESAEAQGAKAEAECGMQPGFPPVCAGVDPGYCSVEMPQGIV